MGSAGDVRETGTADTRQEIMGATYRALCKHGYANLTMQNIADEFDKSKSLLHYHFDSKEDLLVAYLEHSLEWLEANVPYEGSDDALVRLKHYIDRYERDEDTASEDSLSLALLELRLQAVHNDAFHERLSRNNDFLVGLCEDIIRDGIEQGVFRDDLDPRDTAELVYAAVDGARFLQITVGASDLTSRVHDQLIEHVIDSMLTPDARERWRQLS